MTSANEESISNSASSIRNHSPICEICLKIQSKYKCPRCDVKTCSLECCKIHKKDTGCTGQRDKTKYVNKDEFNERLLINDYRFLEEQSRVIDAYQRASELGEEHILKGKTLSSDTVEIDPLKNTTAYSVFENLRKFVYKQFNICLKLMPPQSTRHINNRTRFNRSANIVSWSLEFIFHLESNDLDKNQKYFRFDTKKVLFSTKDTLKSCLNNFYDKFKTELFDKSQYKYQKDESKLKKFNCFYNQFNFLFENKNFDQLCVLFEIRDFISRKKYYIKFGLEKTLEECLKNRTFIEYPNLYIVNVNNLCDYEIIEGEKEKEVNSNNQESICDLNEKTNNLSVEGEEEEKADEEEETEIESSESEDDESFTPNKKLKICSSENENTQENDVNDQKDDQNVKGHHDESDELEEGEERD